MYFPLFVGVLCLSLFCNTLLCVHSIFEIIMKRKINLVALLLSYRCFVTLNVMWLFLTVTWVGLQCVIAVFPDHTHSLFQRMLLRLHKYDFVIQYNKTLKAKQMRNTLNNIRGSSNKE